MEQEIISKLQRLVKEKIQNYDKREAKCNKQYAAALDNLQEKDITINSVTCGVRINRLIVDYTAVGEDEQIVRTINRNEEVGSVKSVCRNTNNESFDPYLYDAICRHEDKSWNNRFLYGRTYYGFEDASTGNKLARQNAEKYFSRLNMHLKDFRVNERQSIPANEEIFNFYGYKFSVKIKDGKSEKEITGYIIEEDVLLDKGAYDNQVYIPESRSYKVKSLFKKIAIITGIILIAILIIRILAIKLFPILSAL